MPQDNSPYAESRRVINNSSKTGTFPCTQLPRLRSDWKWRRRILGTRIRFGCRSGKNRIKTPAGEQSEQVEPVVLSNSSNLVVVGRNCLDDEIVEALDGFVDDLFREQRYDSAIEKWKSKFAGNFPLRFLTCRMIPESSSAADCSGTFSTFLVLAVDRQQFPVQSSRWASATIDRTNTLGCRPHSTQGWSRWAASDTGW